MRLTSAAALGAGLYPNHHVRESPGPIADIPTNVINEDSTQPKPQRESVYKWKVQCNSFCLFLSRSP